MNIANERVEHIKFGPGVITEINDDKVMIQFQDGIGVKIFLYPDAFEKFLKAMNPEVENDIMEECRRKQEMIKLELERKAKEREEAELEAKKAKLELAKEKSSARARSRKKKQP